MAEREDQGNYLHPAASEPTESYTYEPLPTPTSIRLIQVKGRDQNGTLHVQLKTIDLKDKPWFHAVSYTWGNPHTELPHVQETHAAYNKNYPPGYREPIVANGKRLFVSRSAYDVLVSVPRDAWAKRCNRRNPKNQLRANIHSACMASKSEGLEELICAGVDVDVQDQYGRTPLAYAAKLGRLDFVELLLAAGADVSIADENGHRPVDYARIGDAKDVVKFLEKAEERGLSATRKSWPEGPQMWCWIDQICIDQSNLEERGSQVSIMDQIYEVASYTLIWLGLEDRYTKTAVQAILKLHSAQGDLIHSSEIIPYKHQPEEVYAAANIPYVSLDEWTAIATLFLRPYLRRLWVIQENILSYTCIGYCGRYEVPWRAFCTVAQQVYFRQTLLGRVTSTEFIDLNSPVVAIESEILHLTQWKDRLQNGDKASMPKTMSLENLLFETWTFRSTDARDKIFGLYGLLTKVGPVSWRPDYSKPAAHVYANATKEIMRSAGELRMLSAVLDKTLRNIPDLPSWVPDYSVPFCNMMCAKYNAAGTLSPPPHIQPSPWNVLQVSGAKIDAVWQTGNTTSGPKQLGMFFDTRWFELALLLTHPYHNGQARTEALWRTLCADQSVDGSFPAPTKHGDCFREMTTILSCVKAEETARAAEADANIVVLKAAMHHIRQVLSNPPISDLPHEDIQRTFGDPDTNLSSPELQTLTHLLYKLHFLGVVEEDPWTPTIDEIETAYNSTTWQTWDENSTLPSDGSEFHEALRSKHGRRCLFVTKKRYLGLGPASMVDGDEVWVIPGSGAAFVLRPVEGHSFHLIGEAYVHGVMNGEAVGPGNVGLSSIRLI
ncbi:hypothetical protein BBP40_001027 [Aspergillus hancockii]|nr:hypothetical protein BBP40_001027 [Aspergillus hancockii]